VLYAPEVRPVWLKPMRGIISPSVGWH